VNSFRCSNIWPDVLARGYTWVAVVTSRSAELVDLSASSSERRSRHVSSRRRSFSNIFSVIFAKKLVRSNLIHFISDYFFDLSRSSQRVAQSSTSHILFPYFAYVTSYRVSDVIFDISRSPKPVIQSVLAKNYFSITR